MKAIRKWLGLCVHTWGAWEIIWSAGRDPNRFMADDSIELGKRRYCSTCGKRQQWYYPKGH